MSNTYYEEKQVNIAQKRAQLGKPAFEDNMPAVSTGAPSIEYDYLNYFGSPISSGFIKNVQANPVGVQICNNQNSEYSSEFHLEYNQKIDLGMFTNIYKLKVNRIAHDVTFWITVA